MSLSLNNPLFIGDINKKTKEDISQIKQDIGDLSQLDTADKSSIVNALNEAIDSTLNGASRDLDNLSDVGNDKLRSLNSYANNGELLTDPDGLSFVEKYAHSTFDKSKFNFTSGVETTDNGEFIIDGNVKRCKLENVVPSTATDFEFKTRLTINSVGQNGYIFQTYPNTDNVPFTIYINTNLVFALRAWVDVNGTKTSVGFTGNQGTFVAGKTYDFIFERKDGKFTYGYKLADAENYTTGYVTDNYSTYPLWGSNIEYFIGQNITNISYNVDMKNTSVKANGLYTFVGNKTGIDTIKPDNYTVVGTPTISADGIASGFSSSNYIKYSPANILSGKSWNILQRVYWDGSNYTNYLRIADDYSYFRIDAGGTISGNFYNTSNQQIWIHENTKRLNSAGWYYLGLKYEYSTGTFTTFGGTSLNSLSDFDTNTQGAGVELRNLSTGYIISVNAENSDSIDLNAFKIYVDGDLVYQPCLKIPYTESKTGSKIVDSIYRDRVNDMGEQFGYANYYTLSDTDFTLPQVELYGLIGQRTLRDSYRNGINYWELYSNRDLEQGGSCTSGVEITFARPFADTNYVLSVPYSAKSTTAFTPTQTGDWIAKGKGLL